MDFMTMFISMVLVVGSIATIIKNKKTPSRIFQGGIWFPGKDL